MGKKIVIVESPAKSKTISGYLGSSYEVVASYGHIRNLKPKANNFCKKKLLFLWEENKEKIDRVLKKCRNAKEIFIATDMDREGEAIAWHLQEIFNENNINCPIFRITFFEITKKAVTEAIDNKRNLNNNLVNAYLCRVGLDYTMGYTLSPLLWKKLPGLQHQSAGRVQSPALRLIIEREVKVLGFKKEYYFSVNALWKLDNKELLDSKLVKYKNKNSEKFEKKEKAEEICKNIPEKAIVDEVKIKKISLKPEPPFITSSLQQEASRKFSIKVADVMKYAQMLYEGITINGKQMALITYMRTDSFNISKEVLPSIHQFISKNFPDAFSKDIREHKKKVKNSQEAHECIRPIDIEQTPEMLRNQMDENLWQIYNLIWQKTLMSQMKNAIKKQLNIKIKAEDFEFSNTYSKIEEKGFLQFAEKEDISLPQVKKGDICKKNKTEVNSHETSPPSRFSEASLVQEMEKIGIGRPSTYASIIETLKQRSYLIGKKILTPTDKGVINSSFLKDFCSKYVDYDFTAHMENELDKISNGKLTTQEFLPEFAIELNKYVEEVKLISNQDICAKIDAFYQKNFLKKCEACESKLSIQLQNKENYSKLILVIGCTSCNKKINLGDSEVENINDEIKLVKGKGFSYISHQNRKVYLPQNFKDDLTKEDVQFILSLPKNDFTFREKTVSLGMSKYGFYIECDKKYTTIKELSQFKNLNQEKINEILSKSKKYNS